MQKRLIVFVKNPVLGTVKTRLAKSIGDSKALEVYNDLVEKCRKECLAVDAEKHLFYSEQISKDIWSERDFSKHIQSEGDLGEKITAAFSNTFKEQGKVIIIGSDCYDLESETIEEAFELSLIHIPEPTRPY